jgi:hypothetical protein
LEHFVAGGYFFMKKVFTVAVASLVTLLSFAADNPRDGRLRISNFSRGDIYVVVNGRVINDRDDHMLVGGLRPGYHNVKVYRKDHRGRRNRGGIFGRGGGHTLIFNSTVMVTPSAETRVIIDRGGQVYVDRQRSRGGRDRDYDRDYDRDRRDRDWRK